MFFRGRVLLSPGPWPQTPRRLRRPQPRPLPQLQRKSSQDTGSSSSDLESNRDCIVDLGVKVNDLLLEFKVCCWVFCTDESMFGRFNLEKRYRLAQSVHWSSNRTDLQGLLINRCLGGVPSVKMQPSSVHGREKRPSRLCASHVERTGSFLMLSGMLSLQQPFGKGVQS